MIIKSNHISNRDGRHMGHWGTPCHVFLWVIIVHLWQVHHKVTEGKTTKITILQQERRYIPLLPTPGAPTTAIFNSVKVDFLRRMPRVVIVVVAAGWRRRRVRNEDYSILMMLLLLLHLFLLLLILSVFGLFSRFFGYGEGEV